jgi:hypothetical protein
MIKTPLEKSLKRNKIVTQAIASNRGDKGTARVMENIACADVLPEPPVNAGDIKNDHFDSNDSGRDFRNTLKK